MKPNNSSLTGRVIVAMFLGIIIGSLLRFAGDGSFSKEFIVDGILQVVGQIFVISLKMLVVPLVFVSITAGAAALGDPKKLGKIGGKSVGLYLITTAVAVAIALVTAVAVGPGRGFDAPSNAVFEPKPAPSLSQIAIGLFPDNPIKAMAEGNMLQIIVFALLFGVALALVRERGRALRGFFDDLNEVIMKMISILMQLAPYGVFALLARVFAEQGLSAIVPLAKYFLVVLGVLAFHAGAVYPALLKSLSGLSPVVFFRKVRPVQIFAFSTASSNATIPFTMETVEKRLGVSNNVASFTIPLGATINMDGTAIMQGVATVFIAQAFNIELSMTQYLMVLLTATLASIGTAGVPGVGLITLAMVLQQVGLPVEGIAIIMGVDRLLDMARTVVNVTGDIVVTCIVAKAEGEMSVATYNRADFASE